jgi:hypothetical protein
MFCWEHPGDIAYDSRYFWFRKLDVRLSRRVIVRVLLEMSGLVTSLPVKYDVIQIYLGFAYYIP